MKQKAHERLNYLAGLTEECHHLVNRLPVDFNFEVSLSVTSSSVHVSIPYDLNCFRQYRSAMGRGWKSYKPYMSDTHKVYTYTYSLYRPIIYLALHPNMVGATCSIKQVGVRETPIYEVICE